MRTFIVTLLIAGCSPAPRPSEVANQGQSRAATQPTAETSPAANRSTGNPRSSPPAAARSEKLTADTPLATTAGNSFIAPAGWMIFQYSNLLAAVAGYVAAHVADPELELGAAHDRAMQTKVFDPLGKALHREVAGAPVRRQPEAEASVVAAGKARLDELATERKQLAVPADPVEVAKLAPTYKNAALGQLAVKKAGGTTLFDMGEWRIEVASRKNSDGTVSFVTIGAGFIGQNFVAGATAAGKRTLTLRDAQHEYVFEAE